jgi:probable rRNA maturation factor
MMVPMEISLLADPEFKVLIDEERLKDIAGRVLALEGIAEAELGLVITGQERIQELNQSYLRRDRVTDVIAFHMRPEAEESGFVLPPDGVAHLGEVVISYPQAAIQAVEQGHPVARELAILVIHGVLHLLGYGDETPELKAVMSRREAEILEHIEEKESGQSFPPPGKRAVDYGEG